MHWQEVEYLSKLVELRFLEIKINWQSYNLHYYAI